MGVDADTSLVDTSAGELNIQYGWEGLGLVAAFVHIVVAKLDWVAV
jgi:hypothetical protein